MEKMAPGLHFLIMNQQSIAVTWRAACNRLVLVLSHVTRNTYSEKRCARRCKHNNANIVKTALSEHQGGCWFVQSWSDGGLGKWVKASVCVSLL